MLLPPYACHLLLRHTLYIIALICRRYEIRRCCHAMDAMLPLDDIFAIATRHCRCRRRFTPCLSLFRHDIAATLLIDLRRCATLRCLMPLFRYAIFLAAAAVSLPA